MLDRRLRQTKERVLDPVARWLGSRAHPTTITLLGGVVGLLAAGAAALGLYWLGLLLWIINRVLDGLDGTVARIYEKQSDLGGYVDTLVDHVVYAAVPIGLAWSLQRIDVTMALITMLAVFYVNAASWMFLASILEKRNRGAATSGELTTITMPDGIIGGTETVVAYTLFFIVPQFAVALFLIYGGLTFITIWQRMIWAVNNLDG